MLLRRHPPPTGIRHPCWQDCATSACTPRRTRTGMSILFGFMPAAWRACRNRSPSAYSRADRGGHAESGRGPRSGGVVVGSVAAWLLRARDTASRSTVGWMAASGWVPPMTRRSARSLFRQPTLPTGSRSMSRGCQRGCQESPLAVHRHFARPVFSVPPRARCPLPVHNSIRAVVNRQGGTWIPLIRAIPSGHGVGAVGSPLRAANRGCCSAGHGPPRPVLALGRARAGVPASLVPLPTWFARCQSLRME